MLRPGDLRERARVGDDVGGAGGHGLGGDEPERLRDPAREDRQVDLGEEGRGRDPAQAAYAVAEVGECLGDGHLLVGRHPAVVAGDDEGGVGQRGRGEGARDEVGALVGGEPAHEADPALRLVADGGLDRVGPVGEHLGARDLRGEEVRGHQDPLGPDPRHGERGALGA